MRSAAGRLRQPKRHLAACWSTARRTCPQRSQVCACASQPYTLLSAPPLLLCSDCRSDGRSQGCWPAAVARHSRASTVAESAPGKSRKRAARQGLSCTAAARHAALTLQSAWRGGCWRAGGRQKRKGKRQKSSAGAWAEALAGGLARPGRLTLRRPADRGYPEAQISPPKDAAGAPQEQLLHLAAPCGHRPQLARLEDRSRTVATQMREVPAVLGKAPSWSACKLVWGLAGLNQAVAFNPSASHKVRRDLETGHTPPGGHLHGPGTPPPSVTMCAQRTARPPLGCINARAAIKGTAGITYWKGDVAVLTAESANCGSNRVRGA